MNIRRLSIIFLPLIIAGFILYPTYRYSELRDLEVASLEQANSKGSSADSLQVMEEFRNEHGKEYESVKRQRLKLGLDLRGGMYVTMEIDIAGLIEEKAEKDAIDEIFTEVLEVTRKEVAESNTDALVVFLEKFDELARSKGRSLISYFEVDDISEASDESIIADLERDVNSAVDQAMEVIRQRIDKFGVSEPNIQKQGQRRILLELPSVENEAEVRKLLQSTARLEFNLVRNDEKLLSAFRNIDSYLKKRAERNQVLGQSDDIAEVPATEISDDSSTLSEESSTESSTVSEYDELSEDEQRDLYRKNHLFTSLFATFLQPENGQSQPFAYESEPFPASDQLKYYIRIPKDSIAKFNAYLNLPEVKRLIPYGYKVLLSAKAIDPADEVNQVYEIFGVKAEPELTGDVITDAREQPRQTGAWEVGMTMNSNGAQKWSRITGANVNKRIAIVLDGSIYSAPNVNQKINGGNSSISGMADINEATLLATILKAGSLKTPINIVEEKQVGASLGADSIASGASATLYAFILVIIFMIVYYARGGLVADLALGINLILIIGALAAFGGTLTLPGIAGIILTIGMAVDANILIFERIREELERGRSLRSAIDEGFSKALSAILDSNITSFITGVILFFMGTGLIKGFALTLMVGILSTLFTAIVVSRALIEAQVKKGTQSFGFGQPKAS